MDRVTPLTRRVSALLSELTAEEPVIALHGPRSVGKSTVLSAFAAARGVAVLDLDDPDIRRAVVADLAVAVSGPAPLCIDEYQHEPEVLDAIKARLNREGSRPGTAVLTGSTRHDALPRTAQALTGRLHTLTIWPFSQGELASVREDLLEAVRLDPGATVARHAESSTTRLEYAHRLCAGGFPIAVSRSEVGRARWFDGYLRQSIERDALELTRVRQRQALAELLARLAGQTGQVLNVAKAAGDLGIEGKTAESYVRLLEDLFLVIRLPAWGKTLRARATGRPKVHMVDSGLAARLLRLTPARLATLDPTVLTEFGNLLETFVVGELRKQTSWLNEPVAVGHWRTSDGVEVDFVVEYDDGAVLAFEVKAGERVTSGDLRGLRALREAVGDRFAAGIALTTGRRSYNVEDRLHVLPIDRLWRPVDFDGAQ